VRRRIESERSGQGVWVSESSGLFVRVNEDATGDGGRIVLATRQLDLRDGGQISIDTDGEGRPRSLQVLADEVNLAGVAFKGQVVDERGLPYPSTLSALIAGSQSFQLQVISILDFGLAILDCQSSVFETSGNSIRSAT